MTLSALLSHLAFVAFLTLVSAALTRAAIAWLPLVDVPNERSSHAVPIPRSGGTAIVATILIGMAIYVALGSVTLLPMPHLAGVCIALLVIGGMALIDDWRPLGVRSKLGAQVVATAVLLGTGIMFQTVDVPGVGMVNLGVVGYVVSAAWVLGMTNAFNFMDGLNGLAGMHALVVALALAVITGLSGVHFVYISSLIVAGATLGFLVFNFPRARVFMGDTGSQVLGFSFAILGIVAGQLDLLPSSVMLVPVLFFAFLWDTGFTLARRLLAGEPLAAHRTHLYQLLNRLGWSHPQVTALYSGFALFQGVMGWFLVAADGPHRFLVLVPSALVQIAYTVLVIRAARRQGLI